METRQARLERRLGLVGRNLPALYRDAVSLVHGATRLEGASHTVGGHLREIESALREVLMALIDVPRIRNTKENHRQEVDLLLGRLDLASAPAVAPLWRALANPDDEWSLHRLTHRNALDPPRPIDARFRKFWDDAEAMLDGILDAFEERFVDVLRRLDELLASRAPQVDRLRNKMPNTPAAREYFFDRLQDPAWLAPLHQAHFFDYPPDPQPVPGGTRHPAWPETRYLKRMAQVPEAQPLVAKILTAIPDTANLSVQCDLAEILLALPAPLAAPLVDSATRWLATPGHTRIGETLAACAAKLACGGEVARALDLIDALIAVEPREHPPVLDPDDREAPPWVSREAVPRIPMYEYERALERHIAPLADVVGLPLFERLTAALEMAVRLSHVQREAPGPEDYSYIWAPSLDDDHALGHQARGVLLVAVRRVAERLVTREPANLGPILERLAGRPWYVFDRLALHLIHRHPGAAQGFIESWLLVWCRFDAHQLFHEYGVLLRERFPELSPAAQATILGWIDAGPDLEEICRAAREAGNPLPDDEQLEGYARVWRVERLALLLPNLAEPWHAKYRLWKGERPDPDPPEMTIPHTGWLADDSPVEVERFRGMSAEALADFLRDWKPSEDPRTRERSTVGLALRVLAEEDPQRFLGIVGRLRDAEPGALGAILTGLAAARERGATLSWAVLLELCLAIVDRPQTANADDSRALRSAAMAVAHLLEAGLGLKEEGIPIDLRPLVWAALRPLTQHPEPTKPHEEARALHADPHSTSLNTVRGVAMHAVVHYALWVRRHFEAADGGRERVARDFSETPEVREVLEARLDPALEASPAVRAVYGHWFPHLVLLDANWAAVNAPRIFGDLSDDAGLGDVAWSTYLLCAPPYSNVARLLRDVYRAAVERLGRPHAGRFSLGDPDEHLADHLMTLAARGELSLRPGEGLLARFFERATPNLRHHALAALGRGLGDVVGPLRAEIRARVEDLWHWRLEAVRSAHLSGADPGELAGFGPWFLARALPVHWSLPELVAALNLAGAIDDDGEVVARLAEVAPEYPEEAVRAARLMVEGDDTGWKITTWREHLSTLLTNALASPQPGTKAAARALVSLLVSRGHLDFRRLLWDE